MKKRLLYIAGELIAALVVWELSAKIIDKHSDVAFFGGWLFRITALITIAYGIYKAIRKIVERSTE